MTVLLSILCLFGTGTMNGPDDGDQQTELTRILNTFGKKYTSPRTIRIDSIIREKKRLTIYANEALEDIPFRPDNVSEIYARLDTLFPEYRQISLQTRGTAIEELIPEYAKQGRTDKNKRYAVEPPKFPLTQSPSRPFEIKKGLQRKHIALWQSHGMYYAQTAQRWEWQRARLFGTVEDLLPQSFVIPFLIPMLENAGANVLIPRERDTQRWEVIVDNNRSNAGSEYRETNGQQAWQDGSTPGFAHLSATYTDGINPFQQGSFRQTTSLKKGKESRIEWLPSIPQAGDYAVYVSYQTLPNSAEQAFYTIHHAGGESTVAVNQTMGGGTWIYLGHFRFAEGKGEQAKITLTNRSHIAGQVITADAVKLGGGIGNIARNPRQSPYPVEPHTSGYPRFVEAARYWLQWAGMPDTVYSHTRGDNDYRDDMFARGKWVNYLNDKAGIPIDMAFGFHTDAGSTPNDSIIGTLGIYLTKVSNGKYANGKSRETARDLTDCIQSQIVSDIRTVYNPQWSRRGMWNQSYIEARVPEVPTMLLELLAHQNLADMRYALDPKFRFLVSRAIYKGMLRYLCFQGKQIAVVQPLPPRHLHASCLDARHVRVAWRSTPDPLEATARPTAYVLYTRKGAGGFDNGTLIEGEETIQPITPGIIHSYKVAAVNDGGISFPSEIASVYKPVGEEKGTILIVNGFDRISGPAAFENRGDSTAGFRYPQDRGIAYLQEIAFIGDQYEFDRTAPWRSNDQNGFGDSYNNYTGQVIAGNTFDYPFVHGEAIAKAGYAFVSCSSSSVELGYVQLNHYPAVDWILGKQRGPLFAPALQDTIRAYLRHGGNLLVTGAHLLSEAQRDSTEYAFVGSMLKGRLANNRASHRGEVGGVASPYTSGRGKYTFCMKPNAVCYPIESVDGILPSDPNAHTILRYPENNIGAGIFYKGDYRTCLLGFPFEALQTKEEREELMETILRFFR